MIKLEKEIGEARRLVQLIAGQDPILVQHAEPAPGEAWRITHTCFFCEVSRLPPYADPFPHGTDCAWVLAREIEAELGR